MSPASLAALLLGLAAGLSAFGAVRRHGLRDLRPWATLGAAALLWLAAFPPSTPVAAGGLAVLVPGADAESPLPAGLPLLALPDVTAPPRRAERAPDLGTALRRHPGQGRLVVIGHGLPARDRDALAGLGTTAPGVDFRPAPIHGIVAADAATQIALGREWSVSARVEGRVAQLELRDPAGGVVDQARPDADGRARLSAPARGDGLAVFSLLALDAEGTPLDTLSLPLQVLPAAPPLRLLLHAGGPDPELKYLRRWAADAGLTVDSHITLSATIGLADGDPALSTERLAQLDLAIVDDRAWLALGQAERAALRAAVDSGLGLLLRITGDDSSPVAVDWAAFGYSLRNSASANTTLDRLTGEARREPYTLAPARVQPADDATVLLAGDDGQPLAWVRPQGAGRVALSLLTDSYRLRLRGDPARHATLWADLLGALARPGDTPPPPAPQTGHRVDQRSRLCERDGADSVRSADGTHTALLPGADGCAAWWPDAAGWHQLGARWLYVHAAEDGRAWRAAQDRDATMQLTAGRAGDSASGPAQSRPLPRLPFILAWLLLATLLWWRERAEAGADQA